jgi:hypothetical protein
MNRRGDDMKETSMSTQKTGLLPFFSREEIVEAVVAENPDIMVETFCVGSFQHTLIRTHCFERCVTLARYLPDHANGAFDKARINHWSVDDEYFNTSDEIVTAIKTKIGYKR